MDTPNENREPLEDYVWRLKFEAHWSHEDIRRIVIKKGYDPAELDRLLSDTRPQTSLPTGRAGETETAPPPDVLAGEPIETEEKQAKDGEYIPE